MDVSTNPNRRAGTRELTRAIVSGERAKSLPVDSPFDGLALARRGSLRSRPEGAKGATRAPQQLSASRDAGFAKKTAQTPYKTGTRWSMLWSII
jgi:hypothetical protein